MTEITLIAVLAVAVTALTILYLLRYAGTRNAVLLSENAVNELIAAVESNISEGKTAGLADRISHILQTYLRCDRIVFLRYHKSWLRLEFSTGLGESPPNDFEIKLTPALQEKLASSYGVTGISRLEGAAEEEYLNRLRQGRLPYFFPVFLRENLYGIYLLKTSLPPDNPSLNLVATTLAFSLSSAYHMRIQSRRIKKYEQKLRRLTDKDGHVESGSTTKILKYLRLKNCKQLIPELLKTLKEDPSFSKLGFYVKIESSEGEPFAVKWNINEGADKILRESHDLIISKLESENVIDLNRLDADKTSFKNSLGGVIDNGINYLAAIPWADRKRAVLALGAGNDLNAVANRIKKFEREALPLIESVRRFEKAEELSYTDGLTGLYNLRYFKKRIYEEFQRAKRYERYLSLLMLDVDDLKIVNDKYGHLAGDTILKSFAEVLSESVRSNDVFCRYGGDEFCLLMPETDREDAGLFMERIGRRFESTEVKIPGIDKKLHYTVSIGGAVYPVDAKSIDGLIHKADMALLKAKQEGRNCSKLYQPEYDLKA
jgi:diguanylate cyclase (GGDEF)-like protein